MKSRTDDPNTQLHKLIAQMLSSSKELEDPDVRAELMGVIQAFLAEKKEKGK